MLVFEFSLHKESKQHAVKVVKEIDSILNYGEESNNLALNLISDGDSCEKIYNEMRNKCSSYSLCENY